MAFALAASLLNNHFKDIQESSYQDGLPHKTLYGSRKHLYLNQSSLDHKEEVNRTCNNYEGPQKSRKSRDVVARSELAGTGSPGASYPLSELVEFKGQGNLLLCCNRLCCHHYVRANASTTSVCAHVRSISERSPLSCCQNMGFSNGGPIFQDRISGIGKSPYKRYPSNTSIFLYPIIGWAMFLLGVIPLKRMDSRIIRSLDCLKQCITLIKKGASIFFFPEGTRSKDGKLGPFKKGAFSVAAKTRVPVVPITLIGTGEIMPAGMEGKLNPGSVKVVVHPSIIGNNPDELCSEARNVIARGLIRKG
ncbi:hypothetical protein OROHE_011111 [Orobanche hederae]